MRMYKALCLLMGLVASCTPTLAPAQPHEHMSPAGKFYESWNIPPERKSSCCSDQDCYSTLFRVRGGHYEYLSRRLIGFADQGWPRETVEDALKRGEWGGIPDEKLEANQADPRESPDGMNHVCVLSSGYVLCAATGSLQ
jgi:hypothetical protein